MCKADEASNDAVFYDFCGTDQEDVIRLSRGTPEDRKKATVPVSKITVEDVRKIQSMTFFEELAVVLLLAFGVPNGAFCIPAATFLVGKFVIGSVSTAFWLLAVVMLPLLILPQPFVPTRLHSWMALQVAKYFSYRSLAEAIPNSHDKGRPQLIIAPPHGVFPYGNLMAMLASPSLIGHPIKALTSSAALRAPVFKQILRGMGCVDASRSAAQKVLKTPPYALGISTGGVAEVFETDATDECILLKKRKGPVKLAIRTGADMIPSYIFGNTKLLSCYAGEGIPGCKNLLQKLSRKVGFAIVIPFGRFGLPIPRRTPLFAVIGKPIPTAHLKCEEPTLEMINAVHDQLIEAEQELFDRYKHLYGWQDKRLIIK